MPSYGMSDTATLPAPAPVKTRRYRTLNVRNFWDRLDELFVKNPGADCGANGYAFDDVAEVLRVREVSPERILTVVDGDSGRSWWVCPGYHYVNRVFHLILKEGVSVPDFTPFRF